jgi:phenylalanyl-tRNA synthetase beta chain
MRIPYEWLKDYVDVELSPEELAQRLTMAGLEVEHVEYPWPGIITAQITWLERIKGSDHLSATRVTTGREELSVVCGASNIKRGDKVPLATLGTKVGELTIGEKKTMGVTSQGMLCSPRELGLSDDHAGIYILPSETPVGVPLGKLLGNAVIDLDIKAHRGDLFCMVGVAREVSAFTGKPLRLPRIEVVEQGTPAEKLMKLEVRDADLCPRYTARVVRGVKIGPSPDWMQRRLLDAGMRPINNVVDITNYVMLELGQPLHAFDYDKVADHTIVVRRAHPGETITTLDGVTRHLTPEMLLITDPAGPTVIAGIFGGARVEVSETTTDLILEAAHFNPTNVRRTSQALGLRTESSGRFEKNPDTALTSLAIDRAAQLIAELAGGKVAPGRRDFYPKPEKPRELVFHLDQVPWLTGMPVTATEAIEVLERLGFGVKERPQHGGEVVLDVRVPTWRGDVEESADLVEEVARIVGYDRIPSTLPTGPLPPAYHNIWWERENELRDILVGAGLTEIVSYTLTSRTAMARLLPAGTVGAEALLASPVPMAALPAAEDPRSGSPFPAREGGQGVRLAERLPAIRLTNPASGEAEALRLTLMSGLLAAIHENAKHERAGLWLFELGRRYLPTPELAEGSGLAQERRTLGVALTGPVDQSWAGPERPADFYDLKGVAELVLRTLKIPAYRSTPATHPTFHPGRCASLEVMAGPGPNPLTPFPEREGGTQGSGERSQAVGESGTWVQVGILGEVHPVVAGQFEIPQRTYLMELDLERLYLGVPEQVLHTAILRYPAATRDLAIVVDAAAPAAEVADVIHASGGPLLRDVRLFDLYTGEGVPVGKKSLAYSLMYQSSERTLTEAEIEAAQRATVAALGKRFGATLRA